jgi:hypothetical protein
MRPAPALARVTLLGAAFLITGCSSSGVLVPPRLDLTDHGTIGLIQFASGESADLGAHASQEFMAAMYAAQPGVAVVELGAEDCVLQAVGSRALDPETLRAIGDKFRVDAVFVGVLEAKEVRPKLSLAVALSASAQVEVEGRLITRLVETESGATLWSTAASGRETIARVDVASGNVELGARDPDEARGRLVQGLVSRATEDLWSHREDR